MSENNNSHIGSTMIPNGVISDQVIIKKTDTNVLSMNGVEADGIVKTPDSKELNKLLTNSALQLARNDLNNALDGLKNKVAGFTFTPVLSEAIASPHFTDLSKWTLGEWTIDNGRCIYTGKKTPSIGQGILRLNTSAFLHPGNYFIDINLTQLPTNTVLTIVDYHANIIQQLMVAKRWQGIFNVDYPGTYYLDFRVDNCPIEQEVIIDFISIHYIRPEFEEYQTFMALQGASGGHGFVTMDEINIVLANFKSALQNYVNVAIDQITDRLVGHVEDRTTNPHGITPGMIHAAKDNHTHDISSLANAQDLVIEPLIKVKDELAKLQVLLEEHSNAVNPHGITLDYLGGALKDHTHYTSDIDNLDEILEDLQNQIEGLITADNFQELTRRIDMLSNYYMAIEHDVSTLDTRATDLETTAETHTTQITNLTNKLNGINITVSAGAPSGAPAQNHLWFQYI